VKILLLHLSDVHFRSSADPVAGRATRIKEAVVGACPMADACFVVISGDVANSGDPNEYSVALAFLNELRTAILLAGVGEVDLIVVPGNHDCNFRVETDTRTFILNYLSNYFDKPVDFNGLNFELLMDVQGDFFQFEAAAHGGELLPTSQRLYFQRTFTVSGKSIIFHCFNTAWLSRKNEIQSELYVPTECLTGITPPDALLSVAVFHHPYNWLDAGNYRGLKSFVETNADLILTGHEHEADLSRRQGFNGEQMDYLEAPALQEVELDSSGFHSMCFDFDSSETVLERFEWGGTHYKKTKSNTLTLLRNAARPDNPFKVLNTFAQTLMAVGTGFRHPRRTPPRGKLKLRDLYVYPDLRHRQIDRIFSGGAATSQNVPGEQLVDFIEANKKVLIHGADDSGKTSLSKILFEDFHVRGFTPLIVQGAQLRHCTSDVALVKVTEAEVRNQYGDTAVDPYLSLNPPLKVLIVDDFDKCGLPRGRHSKLTEIVGHLYGIVIVLVSDLFRIQELAHSHDESVAFRDFQHCDIKEIGKYHRQRLIEKWHILGREDTAEPEELASEVARSDKTITTLIGKNVLPHYPVTILTLLQLLEATEAPNTANGSYGYLYEVLIKTALAGVSGSAKDVDLQVTYLSKIAYSMFTTKESVLTELEFRTAHDEYCAKYDIVRDCSKMISDFRKAEILIESQIGFSFKYPYIFYYFVAKYFQENATAFRTELHDIADHIYNETNANVLIFYVYLTKDSELIGWITQNAKRIYDEYKPCDMEGDIDFVNKLYT